jgi:hypothetical protein
MFLRPNQLSNFTLTFSMKIKKKVLNFALTPKCPTNIILSWQVPLPTIWYPVWAKKIQLSFPES